MQNGKPRMRLEKALPLYLALVHYPVLNRRGEVIASAVTNLDLHDLARLSCTYGLSACYVVTPLEDQRALVGTLIQHWCEGVGKELHPKRGQALDCLRMATDIEQAALDAEREWGRKPVIWATTAREHKDPLLLGAAGRMLAEDGETPRIILLGTGWGLDSRVLESADAVLEPIRGFNGYNHLSVRCAAAILVDRLLSGER